MRHWLIAGAALAAMTSPLAAQTLSASPALPRAGLDTMISRHAKANSVPESLVHRVVQRESRYNPRAVGRGGAMGLMQIKVATARGMGYSGSAAGLLDAETNLTYAVRYLAGAYRVAGGDHGRAVSFYARGYYYDAKRRGMLAEVKGKTAVQTAEAAAEPAAVPPAPPSRYTPVPRPDLGLESSK